MHKRFEGAAYRKLLGAMEEISGKQFAPDKIEHYARGANEEDLVNSGLEETMVMAYQQTREIKMQHGEAADLRTAALINAIEKIAVCYEDLGIFP
jgi:glutamate dehydrogenase (NAD(P)+)